MKMQKLRIPQMVLLVVTFLVCGAALAADKKPAGELNIYNFEDYFGDTTLDDFHKLTGIKVNLETYRVEEELVAALQSRPGKYDVCFTSDDEIERMIEMRMLERLDLKKIPNLKNIAARWRNPWYDPGHQYSVPYLWGTTGIVVNRKFIKEKVDSWSVLWNPKYKGHIALLIDPEELIASTLKYLGYSANTTDSAKLEQARQKLLEQKPLVYGYLDSVLMKEKLIAGEIWAAQLWSGDAVMAMDKNKDLEYIIPREGAALWMDCVAIPRDAPHKANAGTFIN